MNIDPAAGEKDSLAGSRLIFIKKADTLDFSNDNIGDNIKQFMVMGRKSRESGGIFLREADAEERAYTEILHAIAMQKYAPGDHLAEAKVAQDLNMSRTPVRSALKRMIACGMLEYAKNVGCRIPALTPYDMENVFQVRKVLESQAAALASIRASNVEVETLFGMLEREKEAFTKGDMKQFTKINESFHLGIATLSRNSYLERYFSQTFWRSELYILFFDRFYYRGELPKKQQLRNASESRSCREHNLILNAIADGNEEEASRIMSEHIQGTYLHLTRRERG